VVSHFCQLSTGGFKPIGVTIEGYQQDAKQQGKKNLARSGKRIVKKIFNKFAPENLAGSDDLNGRDC